MGRGQKNGNGRVQKVFRKMKVGDCISGLPKHRITSLRMCAASVGVRFHAYKEPETGYYILKVFEKKEQNERPD